MPTGYYTTARRLHHWRRLSGPYATWTEAWRARTGLVLPPEADTFDVERLRVSRGRQLPVIGDPLMTVTVNLSTVNGADTLLRSMSPDVPVSQRSTYALGTLLRYGLVERTDGVRMYRLTAAGVAHRDGLAAPLTRSQRLARALCASGRIDTGDGVCAGICEPRGPSGCAHVDEVHETWAVSLLAVAESE